MRKRRTTPEALTVPPGPTRPTLYKPSTLLAALLAGARLRRVRHLWPAPKPLAVEDDFITRALVRAYVLPEDEQTRRLASPLREAW